MTLPYLFLDVDGALNALDGLNKGRWPDYRKQKVHTKDPATGDWSKLNVRISPKMCAAIAKLPVDHQWATSWEDQANATLRELTGLPKYPVACRVGEFEMTMHGFMPVEKQWKWLDIQVQLERDPRPMIWIDDEDIPWEAGTTLDERGIRFLLIKPDSNVGITPDHLDDIRSFLAELPS